MMFTSELMNIKPMIKLLCKYSFVNCRLYIFFLDFALCLHEHDQPYDRLQMNVIFLSAIKCYHDIYFLYLLFFSNTPYLNRSTPPVNNGPNTCDVISQTVFLLILWYMI